MLTSKIDKLLADIIDKTRDGQIKWKVTGAQAFGEYVVHSGFIFRSFSAEYEQRNREYTLGFVVKKVPHEDADDERIEKSVPELLILKDDRLILNITQYHVDLDSLRELAALIGDRNEDANELLDNF